MENNKKIFNLLGLAMRAGKVASGEFSTEKAVKGGNAFLVIVSEDASDNTKKKFSNMCIFYKTPIYFMGDKDTLGHVIGKEMRSSLAVVDRGLSEAVMKLMNTNGGRENES